MGSADFFFFFLKRGQCSSMDGFHGAYVWGPLRATPITRNWVIEGFKYDHVQNIKSTRSS